MKNVDLFQKHKSTLPLIEEDQLTPSEYYELQHSQGKRHQRKRAAGRLNHNHNKEESTW